MQRLGVSVSDEVPIHSTIKLVKLAEEMGFESVWIPEDYYYRDAVSRITVYALATEKVKLATSIINPYTRSPPLIAMTLSTIDEISNKRAILGLGPSLRLWLYEPYRKAMKHSLAIKECVDIVRALVSGKTVSYNGQIFKIQNVKLGFKPVRDYIPVYLGVMGPRMLQLAGEMADGVLLTAGATPEYAKFALENIKIGAEKAGRDLEEIDLACLIIFSVAEDPQEAREATKRMIAYLVTLPRFNPILEVSGLQDNEAVTPIREAGRKGDIERAAQYVNDELIEALTISGTPNECKSKLEKFISAGVNLPVILPQGRAETFEKAIEAVC